MVGAHVHDDAIAVGPVIFIACSVEPEAREVSAALWPVVVGVAAARCAEPLAGYMGRVSYSWLVRG